MPAWRRHSVWQLLVCRVTVLCCALVWLGGNVGAGSGVYSAPPSGSDELLVCAVQCSCVGTAVDCSRQQLVEVPGDIALNANVLDLSVNNLSYLPERSFVRYRHLEELNLASNRIVNINADVFHGLTKLRLLNLRGNNLTAVPWAALHVLHSLQELLLGNNGIGSVGVDDFKGLLGLKTLMLDGNRLTDIPAEALHSLSSLEVISFASNNILKVDDNLFQNISSLQALGLASNQIENVTPEAFRGLNSLEILELQHNRLKYIPVAIRHLPSLRKLSVAFNHINHIHNEIFSQNPSLVHADLLGNPVATIERHVFANLTQLKILIIPEAKELWDFPDLRGADSLEFLRIDRARIRYVPKDLCHVSRKLKTLDLKSNSLETVPHISSCVHLRQLQLSGNRIRSIEGGLFRHQELLHDLLLSNNHIESIPADVFIGLHKLEILNLLGNRIAYIHHDAFLPLKQLVYLNVAENRFPQLPAHGLEHVRHLLAHANTQLRQFPSAAAFPHAHTLRLAYAYHCCQFVAAAHNQLMVSGAGGIGGAGSSGGTSGAGAGGARADLPLDLQETVLWLPKDKVDLSLWAANTSDLWPAYHNLTHKFGDLAEDLWGSLSPDYAYPSNLPQVVEDYFDEARSHTYQRPGQTVTCTPQPGPFMPCEDLFDWWTLRCGIWIVFLLAMLGNGAVVFVLVFSRTKMDVPRFLVCNLAGADLCMGLYLGFLAVVDASTLGNFKMHALRWQFSAACQTAGFLGVLSSELSVYTLAVITLERNYAITHAMHLNKRLSLKHAAYIMLAGWTFALLTAALPLLGVSDYRVFAICLPFDIEQSWSLAYVVFLMAVNGLAFLILMGCYLKMYCAIRGSQAWNSNDSRIAKRMALLVFTDLVCWAPIAFFSLTAAFGLQLVTLAEAKVFAIFVLPLNSCANPFLYAILTKQFKKDCVLICKAIEESRVTRGIGRCRHSSNFSNRQTPANTNSAVERNSHNGQVNCSCSRGGSSDGAVPGGARQANGSTPTAPGTTTNQPCSTTRTPDINVPRGGHRRRRRWTLSRIGRALLCAVGGAGNSGRREHDSADSANDYAYAIAEIQKNNQQHHSNHHSRHMSVSSDNFSSSRSDSWRQKSIPLRLLDKAVPTGATTATATGGNGGGGRRNSWTITRKASQDSNLSSSRNDSSATTPSTSTWRVSRSSVSSDMSSNTTNAAGIQQRSTLANLRDRQCNQQSGQCPQQQLQQQPSSSNGCNSSCANGCGGVTLTDNEQSSVCSRPVCSLQSSVRFNLPALATTGERCDDQLQQVPPPTSARPKAKLRRQSAVYEEVSQPSCNAQAVRSSPTSDNPQCLYRRLAQVSGTGAEGESGGGGGRQVGERLGASRRLLNRGMLDSGATHSGASNNSFLWREGFVPRKLSTISSNSCSLNQDSWSTQALATQCNPALSPTQETSGYLCPAQPEPEQRCTSLTDVLDLSVSDPRRSWSDAAFQHRPVQLALRVSTQRPLPVGRRRCRADRDRHRMWQSDNVLDTVLPWWQQWDAVFSVAGRSAGVTSDWRPVAHEEGASSVVDAASERDSLDSRVLLSNPRKYLEDDV